MGRTTFFVSSSVFIITLLLSYFVFFKTVTNTKIKRFFACVALSLVVSFIAEFICVGVLMFLTLGN